MLITTLSNKNLSTALLVLAAMGMFILSSCAPYQARKVPTGHRERGQASWYGPGFAGKKTASGERFNPNAMTAAHKTLPLGTEVEVTNLKTRESVVVRINDRGPFVRGRIIDLSKAAAKKIGVMGSGTARVELAVLGPRDRKVEEENALANEESPDLTEEATASDEKDEVTAGRHGKGVLLASNRHSKTKDRPVRRNGVEYLIEQEEGGKGSSSDVEQEIEKIEKKELRGKKAVASNGRFKNIDTGTDEDLDEELSTDNSEDLEADRKVDRNVKVKKDAKAESADDKIAEALEKLKERRAAKAAGKETEEIKASAKSKPAKTSPKAIAKVAPKAETRAHAATPTKASSMPGAKASGKIPAKAAAKAPANKRATPTEEF